VTAVTPPGKAIIEIARRILHETDNLKQAAQDFTDEDSGKLTIATTHTQARYVLPAPVAALRKRFPKVNVSLHQGTPDQVAQMVLEEIADIGLATESLSNYAELVTLPCYEWTHVAVIPSGHPMAQLERISLEDLVLEPLITYHPSFSGRTRVDSAFAARGLKPNVVLEAIDADVIKTYVRLGLGVGIVAEMAMRDDPQGGDLVWRPVGHLFGQNVARVAFKRGAYLRNFIYAFAEQISSRLSRVLVERAMSGDADDYEL